MKLQLSSILAFTSLLLLSCGDQSNPDTSAEIVDEAATTPARVAFSGPLKLSLAQWSYNKAYRGGRDPYLFAADAKELGFEGVEYVSQLYKADIDPGADHSKTVMNVVSKLDAAARKADITEVLIMIDGEGDLGDADDAARSKAIEHHKHWIDAAWGSGIPTIRVNAGGEGTKAEVMGRVVASLTALGEYGAPKEVNVLVENHGGYSSDPDWLTEVMQKVGLSNVGILPDFGNWCRLRNVPGVWESGCKNAVAPDSIYTAVGMWMPFAKAVSAKSYGFDTEGNETTIDYARMLDTVRAHGYSGFVGIEYEGEALGEREGIMATKALVARN